MRRLVKISIRLVIVIIMIPFLIDLALLWLSSREFIKEKGIAYLEEYLGRDIELKKASLSFGGLKLDGISIANDGGFEKGTLARINRLRLRVDWHHLLHGHVRGVSFTIKGLELNVIRYKNGIFNFSSLLEKFENQESDKSIENNDTEINVTLKSFLIQNVLFSFIDEASNKHLTLSGASVNVGEFTIKKPFEVRLNVPLYYSDLEKRITVPLALALKVDLASSVWERASVVMENISARYEGISLQINGKITNFIDPNVAVNISATNLTNEKLKIFFDDLPTFAIPLINLNIVSQFILEKNIAQIESFNLNFPGLDIASSGKLNYKNITYNFDNKVNLELDELSKIIPSILKQQDFKGTLESSIQLSNKDLVGNFDLQNIEYRNPFVGKLTDLNGKIHVSEKMTFKEGELSSTLTAKLNEESLEAKIQISQTVEKIDIALVASSKRFILPPLPPEKQKREDRHDFVEEVTLETKPPFKWNFPPISLNLDLKTDSIDIPYLYATNLSISSNLTGITPSLKETEGNISFHSEKGLIKDLYKLTNANPFTKVVFLSLNIVGKVFNKLNILGLLKGISGGVVSAFDSNAKVVNENNMIIKMAEDENGNPVAIRVPYTEQKLEGKMKYSRFDTDIYFNGGIATIHKSGFQSDMMSFRLDGTTDFNTEKVKMVVHTAPGEHGVDGIMPLTIKIGGTIASPEASISILGTVTSLAKQVIFNNPISNWLKRLVRKFIGLFKKEKVTPIPQN